MEKVGSSVVDVDGYVNFEISHYSTYLLSLDDLVAVKNPATEANYEIIALITLIGFIFMSISLSLNKLN